MFGTIGHWEVLVVLAVLLILFGHRLPSMMRSLGRSVTEFKKGVHGVEDDAEAAVTDKKKTE